MAFDPAYADAISSIESGGRYDALGPDTKGDRAYGKYQVMGLNIPQWTKEHYGKELTPQEFLANPQAQDAVFAGQFSKYVDKYGNPQDAASAWFTGRHLAQGGESKDVLGTSGSGYVAKFNAALSKSRPPQVASVPAFNAPPQPSAPLPAFGWSPGASQPSQQTEVAQPSYTDIPSSAPQLSAMQPLAMPQRRAPDLSRLAALLHNAPPSIRQMISRG